MLRGKKLVWKIPASHYDSKKPLGLPLLSSKPVIVVKKLFYDVENFDYDFFSRHIHIFFILHGFSSKTKYNNSSILTNNIIRLQFKK